MPSVCILGGGYAGLRVARALSGRLESGWTITLVDRGTCHQLITRLPEVVAGTIAPEAACLPFATVLTRRVTHLAADIASVDLESRAVTTSHGEVRADIVVIAFGTAPYRALIPGAVQHTTPLKSVEDAVRIRDTIAGMRRSQSLVSVVIVGAGYTGTEVAGELTAPGYADRRSAGLGRVSVRLVAEDPRLLPQASTRLSNAVETILRARGVPIHLGQSVDRVDGSGVHTRTGDSYGADLVIWAGETRVAWNVIQPAAIHDASGKLPVDPYLRVRGDEDTFACGDIALVYDFAHGRVAASSAQLAVQEGDTVARNVASRATGRPPVEFRPHVLGEALGLGDSDGAAEVGGAIVTGRAAIAVKRAALVRYLAGLSRPRLG